MTAPAAGAGAETSGHNHRPLSSSQPQLGGAAAADPPAIATDAVPTQPASDASQSDASGSSGGAPEAAAGGPSPAASAPASVAVPGKACSSVAAAAQQRHAGLAAVAARRTAEAGAGPAAVPSGESGPNGAHPAASRPASGNAAVGDGAGHPVSQPGSHHAGGHTAACGGRKGRAGPPPTAQQTGRRAKRRRRHEAQATAQRHLELRRRVADITAEYEALQNEVNHIRAMWAEPPPLLENPLTEADLAQLAANAARRITEVMQRGPGAALKSVMSHKWSYPFNEPVDTARYDNYLSYVKRPMDFGTIKRSLEAGAYADPKAMLEDVRQVFTNAFLFNPAESNVAVMAKFLQDKFEDRWQQTVTNKLLDAAASTKAEEVAALRAANEAAQAARTEGLMARAELLTNALDELGHRLADAQSLAASHCEPVSLQEKDELARGIGALGQDAFGAAMGLLVGRAPELHPGSCDMIVDMDRLDALTLRQLQHFVIMARAAGAVEDASGSGGASDSGGGPDGGGGNRGGDGKATPQPVVWPELLAGSGLRGYRIPHFRGAIVPEQASGDPVPLPASEAQPASWGPRGSSAQTGGTPAAAQHPPGQQDAQALPQQPSQQQAPAEPSQEQLPPDQQHTSGQQQIPADQLQPPDVDDARRRQQQLPQQAAPAAEAAPWQQPMPQQSQEPEAAAQPQQRQQHTAPDNQLSSAAASADATAPRDALQQAPPAVSAANAAALDRLLSTRESAALSSGEPEQAARQAADRGLAMLHDDTHEGAEAGVQGRRDLQHQGSSAVPDDPPQPLAQLIQQQQQQQAPPLPQQQQAPEQRAPPPVAGQGDPEPAAVLCTQLAEQGPLPRLAALPTLRPPKAAVSAALEPDYVPQFGSHSPRAAALLPSSRQKTRTLQDALRERSADLLQGGAGMLPGGPMPTVAAALATEPMQE